MKSPKRHQVEEELRTEKERFQILSEHAPFGMVMIDKDGIFRYINPKFRELFGYDLKDIPNGKTWFKKAYPDPTYRHHIISAWLDDLKSSQPGEKRPRVYTVACKDRTEKIVNFISVQLETGENLMTCEDISQRRQAEKVMEEKERFFSSIFGSIQDGISILDKEMNIIQINPIIEKWYLHALPLIGKKCYEAYHSRNERCDVCPSYRTIKTGEAAYEVVPKRGPGGKITGWLDLYSSPLMDMETGQMSGIIEYVRDITEHKRAEDELLRSEWEAKRLAQENAIMAEIGRIISSSLNINEVYERFTEAVRRFIHFDRIAINIINPEKNTATISYIIGVDVPDSRPGDIYPLAGSATGKVVYTRSSLLIQTEDEHELTNQFPSLLTTFQAGLRSMISVPLISKDEVIGVLHIRSLKTNAYTEADLRLAERVGNQIAGAIANAQFFLERKQAEEKYRTIVCATMDGFWIVDMQGRFLEVNDAYCCMIGYSRDELLTMTISDVEAIERPEDTARRIQKIMEVGGDRFETRHRCKDGRIIDIEVSVNYMEVGGGRMFVFLRDITERKRAEEALSESEERFKDLYDNAPLGYHEYDKEGRITKVNCTDLEMLGYTAEEMIGQFMWKFNVEEEIARQQILAKLAGTLPPGKELERIYRRKDGTTFPVLIEDRLILDEKGQIKGIRCTIQDITERKRAEEELLRSEEEAKHLAQENAIMAEIGQIISSTLNTEEIYERFAEEVNKLIPFDRIAINIINPKDQTLTIAYVTGVEIEGRKTGDTIPLAGTMTEEVMRKRSTLLIQTNGNEELARRFPRLLPSIQAKFKSLLSAPLISKDQVIGVLHIRSTKPNAYSERDLKLAERVGNQIAGAIANTQLFVERKGAEEALQIERQRFQKISEHAPFGLVMIDKDGTFIYINPKFTELFGYDITDIPNGKTWFREAYPDPTYRHNVISAWINDLKIFTPGEKRQRVYTVTCKDGTEKIVNFISIQLETGENLMTCEDITEHMRFEKILRESEERYRKLFEGSRDAVYITTREGEFIDFNQAFLDLFGYSKEELMVLHAQDTYVHPVDRYRFRHEIEEKEFVRDYEVELRKKDGKEMDCLLTASVRRGNDGTILGYQGFIRDISERKRAEEALRESEEKCRSLVNNIKLGIFRSTMEPSGKFIEVNLAMEEITGYSREELLSMNVSNLYVRREERETVVQEVAAATGKTTKELNFRKKDGAEIVVSDTKVAVRDNTGRVLYFDGIIEDITERKRTEEALRESEERFRDLYDNAPLGYHEYNLEGRITNVNQTDLEMLGYSREEMVGQYMWKFNIEEEIARKQILEKLAGKRPPGRSLERTYRRKDGTTFPVLIEDRLILDEKGRIKGIRCTIQDITERKETEKELAALQEQLRQSQKMEAVGRLAGGITHDFNNILTIIKGYSQLSLSELKEGHPLRENIEGIQKATDRASDLIRKILAFGRRQVMEMRVIDLNTLLMELDNLLRRVIGEDIELATVLAEDLGRVKVDPGQIEQVILNLAVNAKDAMPNGGKLTIETANTELDEAYARSHLSGIPGRYVMLSVSDTGVGMTSEVKERIFEPFYTTKEKGKGTGLGLSTVYGIVKQSGGNIWVYSEPGQGTTFKIYLPRVDELTEEVREKVVNPALLRKCGVKEELPRGSETVLVVEDEEELRKLAVRILEKQGYEVWEASHGHEALSISEKYENKIHLLVTDVVMPGMSGRELSERLMSLCPEIKILYMSGHTNSAIVHHGTLEPGVNLLQKPFNPEALARKVREVLDR